MIASRWDVHKSKEVVMKRASMILIAVLLAAAPAAALEQGLQEGQAAVGAMLPMGDFGDYADTGFMFGAGYGYYVTPTIALGAQFDYHMFGTVDENVDGNIFSYRAYGKYTFMGYDSTPYVKVLLGAYTFGQDDIIVGDVTISTDNQTDMGIAFGAGYQYRGASNIGFFGEAIFNLVFNSTDPAVVDIGGEVYEVGGMDNSAFVNLRAGVTLYWGGRGGMGY